MPRKLGQAPPHSPFQGALASKLGSRPGGAGSVRRTELWSRNPAGLNLRGGGASRSDDPVQRVGTVAAASCPVGNARPARSLACDKGGAIGVLAARFRPSPPPSSPEYFWQGAHAGQATVGSCHAGSSRARGSAVRCWPEAGRAPLRSTLCRRPPPDRAEMTPLRRGGILGERSIESTALTVPRARTRMERMYEGHLTPYSVTSFLVRVKGQRPLFSPEAVRQSPVGLWGTGRAWEAEAGETDHSRTRADVCPRSRGPLPSCWDEKASGLIGRGTRPCRRSR